VTKKSAIRDNEMLGCHRFQLQTEVAINTRPAANGAHKSAITTPVPRPCPWPNRVNSQAKVLI